MQAERMQAKPLPAGQADQTGGQITMQICD
jgi:hypothetical protein